MSPTMTLDDACVNVDQRLAPVTLATDPFPHFTVSALFDEALADAARTWLEQGAPWTSESRVFYVQHACTGLTDRLMDTPAQALASPQMIDLIRRHFERIFGEPLSPTQFALAAHRMVPGHRIGIHNDRPSNGTERYRLVVNLSRDFDQRDGGELVLFGLDDPAASAVIVPPVHNSAAAMQFSERSWHCVEEISQGTRYTLLYSFWPAATDDDATASGGDDTRSDADQSDHCIDDLCRFDLFTANAAGRDALASALVTHRLLEQWRCDTDTFRAGLLTELLVDARLSQSLGERLPELRDRLGERAFMLAETSARTDSGALEKMLAEGGILQGGLRVSLNRRDQQALAVLFWAGRLRRHWSGAAPIAVETLRRDYATTRDLLPPEAVAEISGLLR